MIAKTDLLARSAEWGLRPDVVEKDYVLGWLLAGFALHPATSRHWVFKGGTCLKKCYLETFRFSEDLDFSLLPDGAYTVDELRQLVVEAAELAATESGISFPPDGVDVLPRRDKLGRPTFVGKIAYRGPLAVPTGPKIQLDITQQEPVLDSVTKQSILHPYPDLIPEALCVSCYSLEELFAEKCRALLERTRPRDLYDVVHIGEARRGHLDLRKARELFEGKCRTKGLAPPNASSLVQQARGSAELAADWSVMLAHQLRQLPPIEQFLDRLPEALSWLDRVTPTPVPVASVPLKPGEEIFRPRGGFFWQSSVPLEGVRFAGTNRLLIEFDYRDEQGKLSHRLIEPYSFRVRGAGNRLLYGWDLSRSDIRAFNTRNISNLKVTDRPFAPRFSVEFVG
ncbi:MAG: nucleotidyl transferase AbiEii/AbiGii toxin family protein [Deltaproteobacteria bacterium]